MKYQMKHRMLGVSSSRPHFFPSSILEGKQKQKLKTVQKWISEVYGVFKHAVYLPFDMFTTLIESRLQGRPRGRSGQRTRHVAHRTRRQQLESVEHFFVSTLRFLPQRKR